MSTIIEDALFLPERWGLSQEAISGLGNSLEKAWTRLSKLFQDEDPG